MFPHESCQVQCGGTVAGFDGFEFVLTCVVGEPCGAASALEIEEGGDAAVDDDVGAVDADVEGEGEGGLEAWCAGAFDCEAIDADFSFEQPAVGGQVVELDIVQHGLGLGCAGKGVAASSKCPVDEGSGNPANFSCIARANALKPPPHGYSGSYPL